VYNNKQVALYVCCELYSVFSKYAHEFIHVDTYSRTPLIWINLDGDPSAYAENTDNWIFFENRLHWQFEVGEKDSTKAVLGYIFIDVQIKH
jgi:hypothetical protein